MGLQIRNRNKYKKEVEKRYGENNEILDAGSALMRGVNWKKSKKKRGKETMAGLVLSWPSENSRVLKRFFEIS